MDESATFATKAELEQVKREQKRMAIKLEEMDATLAGLTSAVADLADKTDRRFDELEARMVERHTELTRLIEDRHRALISAVMAPRRSEGES
jgi:hypothetical protein